MSETPSPNLSKTPTKELSDLNSITPISSVNSNRQSPVLTNTSDSSNGKRRTKFAPLTIPLPRRLQTFAVLWHTISIPIFTVVFLFLWVNPFFWWLGISYLIWWLVIDFHTPTNGRAISRYSKTMRSLVVWKWFAGYFPINLHRTVELPPTYTMKKIENEPYPWPLSFFKWRPYYKEVKTGPRYLFGYHPHGVISMGVMGSFATEGVNISRILPGIKVFTLTLLSQFNVPFYRDYLMSLGLTSASAKNITCLLRADQSVVLVVGGAQESLLAKPGTQDIVLQRRKGFIKLALEVGDVSLVPVYGFGETDIYNIVQTKENSIGRKIQLWMKDRFQFTIPFFFARGIFNYDFGFLPFRKEINLVIGEPIAIPFLPSPSRKEIDHYHKLYIDNLKKLFEENKHKYGYDDAILNIVE